jgi:hypothetical protein
MHPLNVYAALYINDVVFVATIVVVVVVVYVINSL